MVLYIYRDCAAACLRRHLGRARRACAGRWRRLHRPDRAGAGSDPGDGLAQLDALSVSGNAQIGAQDAAVAGSSYSVAPLSSMTLTGSASAVFVLDPDTKAMVACGEIGGVLGADGALSIGLRSANDSGLSGIAYLAPIGGNPAQTGISTFLARTGGGGRKRARLNRR